MAYSVNDVFRIYLLIYLPTYQFICFPKKKKRKNQSILMKHFCFAELLRVIRRLSMKEQWTDTSVQCLTLRTLRLVLTDNPRGQNHFKSIGGLEVILDGLGLPYTNVLLLKNEAHIDVKRYTRALSHTHTEITF